MDPEIQTDISTRISVLTMTKKTYTSAFKAQVVLDILKEEKTTAQLASEYGIHPNLLRDWKLIALKALPAAFEKRDALVVKEAAHELQLQELYAEIGRLTTHVTFLKKTSPVASDIPSSEKRFCLPPGAHPPTIDHSIPKTRPSSLLVCGRHPSDQNP